MVDCGAYEGDTIERFLSVESEVKIYAVEPSEKNILRLEKMIVQKKLQNKVIVCNCASWSENKDLFFEKENSLTAGKCGTTISGVKVAGKTIDSILEKENRCDLIKMDVEGAELESLKGAKTTILKYHPQLAICIYHKTEDMIDIPEYIKQLCPDYKLYIRHHTANLGDMVLYAVL